MEMENYILMGGFKSRTCENIILFAHNKICKIEIYDKIVIPCFDSLAIGQWAQSLSEGHLNPTPVSTGFQGLAYKGSSLSVPM